MSEFLQYYNMYNANVQLYNIQWIRGHGLVSGRQARRTRHFASKPVILSAWRHCHSLSLYRAYQICPEYDHIAFVFSYRNCSWSLRFVLTLSEDQMNIYIRGPDSGDREYCMPILWLPQTPVISLSVWIIEQEENNRQITRWEKIQLNKDKNIWSLKSK